MAGEIASSEKFPTDESGAAFTSCGSELKEWASCALFVCQFAKLYAVPPQLNGVPDAGK